MSVNEQQWDHLAPVSKTTKLIWTIENYSARYIIPGEILTSTVFFTGKNYKDQWQLLLYPKGQSPCDKKFVDIYLELIHSVESHIKADVMFSIVKPGTDETTRDMKISNQVFVQKCKHGVKKIIYSSDITTYLKDDTLKMSCEIIPIANSNPSSSNPPMEMTGESADSSVQPLEESVTLPPRLCDHLWTQFQNSKNSNLMITVGEEHFHVHKFILQARSSVFAAMFDHELNENLTHEIVIESMTPVVVKKTLQFLYTDRIDDFEKMAGDLLIAANTYALDGLQALCERVLCEQIEISNAVMMLILANNCNSTVLKKHAAKFINVNLLKIINMKDYEGLEESYPDLVLYLIRTMASQMSAI